MRGKECISACESALGFPWQGVRATAVLLPSFLWSWPVLGMALAALPALVWGQDAQLGAGKELVQLLIQVSAGILPAAAAVTEGSHLIAFPAHVLISLAAGMGRGREGKARNCAALCWGRFALLGCSGLETSAGMSPRQTAPSARPRELCSHTAARTRSPAAAGGNPH